MTRPPHLPYEAGIVETGISETKPIDDTTIFYCQHCEWESEPMQQAIPVNECGVCRRRNVLRYVSYRAGVEEADARKLIETLRRYAR